MSAWFPAEVERSVLLDHTQERYSPGCLQVIVFHSKDHVIGSLEHHVSRRTAECFAEAGTGDAQRAPPEWCRHDLHVCVVHYSVDCVIAEAKLANNVFGAACVL